MKNLLKVLSVAALLTTSVFADGNGPSNQCLVDSQNSVLSILQINKNDISIGHSYKNGIITIEFTKVYSTGTSSDLSESQEERMEPPKAFYDLGKITVSNEDCRVRTMDISHL